MAKCGITNISGGGSASSDDCTATKDKVLKGYTALTKDSNDEVNEGTIPTLSGNTFGGADETAFETSPIVGAANNNAVGAFDYSLHGYFDNDAVRVHIPNLLPSNIKAGVKVGGKKGSLTGSFTSDANAQSSHILAGQSAYVNGVKVNGTMPIQSGDAAGDQVWAINRTAWNDGNLFFGVRNGHYLNGVNWIRAHDPAFVASNIKKGTTMWGITGNFEGYVPTASDLYLKGNNNIGFKCFNVNFESGGISVPNALVRLESPNMFNFNPYKYLNVELFFNTQTSFISEVRNVSLVVTLDRKNIIAPIAIGKLGEISNSRSYTISIPLINVSFTDTFMVSIYLEGQHRYESDDKTRWVYFSDGRWSGWIYKVWMS
jgi:hypothetical protein